MNSFDLYGYHLINQWAGRIPILDKFMLFTHYAIGLYALLFVVCWFTLPKPEENRRHALIVAVFSAILALLINVLVSQVWLRPRPFVSLPSGSFTQLILHSIHDNSFPSDHVSDSFAFAAVSWKNAGGWVSYSSTILAILVAISRIYTGVHWPSDVLAGVIVGLLSARIMWALSPLLKPITEIGFRLFHFGPYSRHSN